MYVLLQRFTFNDLQATWRARRRKDWKVKAKRCVGEGDVIDGEKDVGEGVELFLKVWASAKRSSGIGQSCRGRLERCESTASYMVRSFASLWVVEDQGDLHLGQGMASERI